ncbi:MAG: hypothetical protein FRX49_05182 [Trebouxia sp. A1-2]|nr:MAG: hypothetical protein FRX49_05182 [Trebouxia sp. A1-2]
MVETKVQAFKKLARLYMCMMDYQGIMLCGFGVRMAHSTKTFAWPRTKWSQDPRHAAIRKQPTPGNKTAALLMRSSKK